LTERATQLESLVAAQSHLIRAQRPRLSKWWPTRIAEWRGFDGMDGAAVRTAIPDLLRLQQRVWTYELTGWSGLPA
jgi:hypothetical protein